MSKVYFKKDRLKYGFLWMLIFAGASFLVSLLEINWLSTTLMIFAGLSLITGMFGTNDDAESPIGLTCPKCKIFHPLLNLNLDTSSTIYVYGEHIFRTRKSDGLNIYPFLCLKCKTITEYASDPQNQSGHSVCGHEYFDTKKITKKDIDDVLSFATIHQHQHIIDKLKNFNT